jgi:cytidylate kinase
MEMDRNAKRGNPKPLNESVGKASQLSKSQAGEKLPFPDVPATMVIAIDGWAQTGKNTTGALVAQYLGGVLVDSGRFYRAVTRACIEAGLNIHDHDAVTSWLKSATVDVHLARDGGDVSEAQVAINGKRFIKEDLKDLGLQVSAVAAIPAVRELVNERLRACEALGRVVMLGRDIGGHVFPQTPYKFFLDATEEVREQRHVKSTNKRGAVQRDTYDANNVMFTDDSLLIDTSRLEPERVCGVILVEVFWRAEQLKNKPAEPQ